MDSVQFTRLFCSWLTGASLPCISINQTWVTILPSVCHIIIYIIYICVCLWGGALPWMSEAPPHHINAPKSSGECQGISLYVHMPMVGNCGTRMSIPFPVSFAFSISIWRVYPDSLREMGLKSWTTFPDLWHEHLSEEENPTHSGVQFSLQWYHWPSRLW